MADRTKDADISGVDLTLANREADYGDYTTTARCASALKSQFRTHDNYHDMSSDKREAMDMIAVKLARILTGNPDLADNWHDIAGYAVLAERGCPATLPLFEAE